MTLFFYGPNRYALRHQVEQMAAAYVAKAGSDLELVRLDGATASAQELSGTLTATPFLASSRLVIVEGVATNKVVGAKLAKLLTAVPVSTVAVFCEREVDQRTAAFKTLKASDKVVKFEPVTGQKLLAWIGREVKVLGGDIDGAAARELVEMAGEDQWRLSEEINKLVNYNSKIGVEQVRELVTPTPERSIFELVEILVAGHSGEALVQYRQLLAQKHNELYILTMIQWQLRNLLLAKTAPSAMSSADLAAAAGLSPYVAGKAAALRGRVSEPVLAAAFQLAAECEFDIKTGRRPAEAAVEQLIWQVAEAVRQ